jgi:hypothetical protein
MTASTQGQLDDDYFFNKRFPVLVNAEIDRVNKNLRVTYGAGPTYSVPLDYVDTWYDRGPHEVVSPESSDLPSVVVGDGGTFLQLTLEGGSLYIVAWDTILMACEPDYEYFGGLTDFFKTHSRMWLEKAGPFRV